MCKWNWFTPVAGLLAATLLAVGCDDPAGPARSALGAPNFSHGGAHPRITGLGTLGAGSATPGSDRQEFDFDVVADMSGRLFYRDWTVVRPDSTVGTVTVEAADTSTAITAFRDWSAACADSTRGAEFDGTGRLDTGGLTSFTVATCDNGAAGTGVDFFQMDVPPHAYTKSGFLSSGDVAKSAGRHYYASPSPTGNDANPCTSAAPCYTMQRISQLMSPGDTAHFAPGTYSWTWSGNKTSKSGTASARITYISDVKWGAKVVGVTCTPIYNDGDYVDIVNFDVTASTCPEGITANGNYNKVIGNRVHDLPGSSGGYCGICGSGSNLNKTGIEIIGNVVDNIGPFGQTNVIHGIYLAGPNGKIMNNIVTRASAACIATWHYATREIISNNVVANCGRYGIQISADPAVATNDYTTVSNNIVANVATYGGGYGWGIQEYPAVGTHNVYYNNIVYNNAGGNFALVSGTQSGTITLTSAQFSALFVNYTGDRFGDYRLRSGAVAIDAGTTSCAAGVSECVPTTDFDGVARPQGAAYDIGAYEGAVPPGAGPVASWSFDEGSGQTASDGSGNNNTATLGVTTAVEASDPLWVPGRINYALQFDSISSRVTVPGSPTINNLSAFTYAAWIYPTGSGGGGYGRAFSKETSAGFDEFYLWGTTALEAAINNTSGIQYFATSTTAPALNTWSHVAVIYNDSGDRKLHLYINGSEVAYSRQDIVSGTLRTTANTVIIGNRIAGDRAFQGKIDEARLYNRALSASEVAALAAP